jgi:hypothetical protein
MRRLRGCASDDPSCTPFLNPGTCLPCESAGPSECPLRRCTIGLSDRCARVSTLNHLERGSTAPRHEMQKPALPRRALRRGTDMSHVSHALRSRNRRSSQAKGHDKPLGPTSSIRPASIDRSGMVGLCPRCLRVWFPHRRRQSCPEGPHGRTLARRLLARCCDYFIPLDHVRDHLQTIDSIHPHATSVRTRNKLWEG